MHPYYFCGVCLGDHMLLGINRRRMAAPNLESLRFESKRVLTEALTQRLFGLSDIAENQDHLHLLNAHRSIAATPQSTKGLITDLTDLLNALKGALAALNVLRENQKQIRRASKEIDTDILHKLRYVERVAIAFGTMAANFENLPDTDEPSRALLLRAAGYLEDFSNAESKHTDVKSMGIWEKHKTALVSKKIYALVALFYDEFRILATDLTRHNEHLAKEVKAAKNLLYDAWYDGSPAANRSLRHLLEAARSADSMGGAILSFMEALQSVTR